MASGSKKVVLAALIGNGLITVTKAFASVFTGSSAMLSEAIHSLVDTSNQALLLYGMGRAKRPADADFPFGYGKEIYFWSFVVAILIFALGAGVSLYQGIVRVMHPHPLTNPAVNYLVLISAMVFESGALYFAVKEFNSRRGRKSILKAVNQGKDPSLFVVLFEDCAALLGLMAALIGIALAQITGNPIWDGVASLVISAILAFTSVWLAIETKSLLIGEGADTKTRRGIRKIIKGHKGVKKVNEVLTLHMGPEYILANISIDFDDEMPVVDLEKSIAKLDRTIKEKYPFIKRIFVEAEANRSK